MTKRGLLRILLQREYHHRRGHRSERTAAFPQKKNVAAISALVGKKRKVARQGCQGTRYRDGDMKMEPSKAYNA